MQWAFSKPGIPESRRRISHFHPGPEQRKLCRSILRILAAQRLLKATDSFCTLLSPSLEQFAGDMLLITFNLWTVNGSACGKPWGNLFLLAQILLEVIVEKFCEIYSRKANKTVLRSFLKIVYLQITKVAQLSLTRFTWQHLRNNKAQGQICFMRKTFVSFVGHGNCRDTVVKNEILLPPGDAITSGCKTLIKVSCLQ